MKKAEKFISALLILPVFIVSLSFGGCSDSYKDYGRVFNVLWCDVRLNGGGSKKAGKEIFKLMEEIDNAVSTSNPSSPVYKFNNNENKTVSYREEIDFLTYDMAKHCKEIYGDGDTQGAFDPAVYPLVEAWGVSSDKLYRGHNEPPDKIDGKIDEYLAYCRYEYLDIIKEGDGEAVKYYFGITDGKAKALKIDFGAYAKGYAADKAAEICKKHGVKYGTVNISGNVILIGAKPDGSDWYVDLTNPFWAKDGVEDEPFFCTFAAKACSPVSSGVYERYYSVKSDGAYAGSVLTAPIFNGGNVYVTHIIDPATGYPINLKRADNGGGGYTYYNETGVVNATVFHQSSALADAYATVVTVLGMDKGIEFLEKKGLSGIIVTGDGKGENVEYAVVGGVRIAGGGIGEANEFYKKCAVKPGYGFAK